MLPSLTVTQDYFRTLARIGLAGHSVQSAISQDGRIIAADARVIACAYWTKAPFL